MPFIFNSVFPAWVVWLLAIEAVLVGVGFVILWTRKTGMSFKATLIGWLACTVLLFAVTLVLIYVVVPIIAVLLAVLLAALVVVLLFALVASLFRRKSGA